MMPRTAKLVPGLLLLALAVSPPSVAQEETSDEAIEALRQEIEQLKTGQTVIRRQLAEIKALIQKGGSGQQARKDQVPDVTLDLAGYPARGSDDAPLTLVEFADYQWPYCARHVRETLPQLVKNYVDTGKLRYVASDFPLPNHPHAFKAAVAAHCAEEQGKFWEMSEKIFENYRALQPENLPGYAGEVGLDAAAFAECLAGDHHDAAINKRKADASRANVSATPSFLLGYTQAGSKQFKPAELIRGAVPYATFQQKIEDLLKKKGGK